MNVEDEVHIYEKHIKNVRKKIIQQKEIIKKFNNIGNKIKSKDIEFNINEVCEIYIIDQKRKKEFDSAKYAMFLGYYNNNFSKIYIVKVDNISSIDVQISYFNTNFNLLLKINLNRQNGISFIEYKSNEKDMGQDVMNCIADAYSNEGWISVWISVQTAFIP